MSTTTGSQPEPTTEPSSGSTTPEDSTTAKSSTEPAQETTSPPAEAQQETPEPSPENREAAKYRVRLREAEAQRDAATQRLESVTVNVIEQKLQHLGVGVKALKAAGVDLASVYDDDGQFDDQRLLEAVQNTHEALGLPTDYSLNKVASMHSRTGRVNWEEHAMRGVVPSAGTGGERPITSGWNNVINSR